MKVCFLVGTLGRGGAEKQLLFMLRAAQQAGIGVRVLCLTEGECHEYEIRRLGIPVEWVGKSKNRAARLVKIIANLRKTPADVVQSTHFYTNIYAALAGKAVRIPSIGAIRSDLDSEILAHGRLGKWQISLPEFLIANSLTAYERAVGRGIQPQKIAFVRNAVEINSPIPHKSLGQNGMTTFLWVGRFDENKKPERFVKLAFVLSRTFTNKTFRFLMAGDGARLGEIKKLATDLRISGAKLQFLGDCADINEIYRQADALVSTSDCEGTSNVILEAMAWGLPIVATRVGGTPEIVNEERGVLISPDSESQLFAAAADLISSPVLRIHYGNNGRKYVEENHSLDYLSGELSGIYKKLIGQAAR